MKYLTVIIAGITFGIGLAFSGMTDTTKVQGFLDVLGNWDASLVLVLAGAVSTTLVSFRFLLKRKSPILTDRFVLPLQTTIDPPLVIGAILFGIGWAIVGYCPGPAFAALAYFQWQTFLFVAVMLLGALLGRKLSKVTRA
jgi:uncharacterized protein